MNAICWNGIIDPDDGQSQVLTVMTLIQELGSLPLCFILLVYGYSFQWMEVLRYYQNSSPVFSNFKEVGNGEGKNFPFYQQTSFL